MKKEIEEKIENVMTELNPDYYIKGYDWNGYEVYEPKYVNKGKQTLFIGYPYICLVKGDEVRLSSVKESLEYLDYSNEMKAKSKSSKDLKEDIQEEI